MAQCGFSSESTLWRGQRPRASEGQSTALLARPQPTQPTQIYSGPTALKLPARSGLPLSLTTRHASAPAPVAPPAPPPIPARSYRASVPADRQYILAVVKDFSILGLVQVGTHHPKLLEEIVSRVVEWESNVKRRFAEVPSIICLHQRCS